MGVKNLWDILESCKKTLPLSHLQNKRVCVDLSCWIVQLHVVNKSHCSVKENIYLKGLFHRLRALIALNCSLIFVSDGSIPAIKLSTYRRRLNAGNEPLVDIGNPPNALSVKRNMGSEFSCMIKEAKVLGGALGIPCLDGIEEAEAQCALLNSESLCDGCFTLDSDVFLFGARTVYREICLGEGGYVVCYEMDDIETKLGFGRNSLIALAMLLGSDYNQGVRGFRPYSACQFVKSIGDATVLQRFASEGLSFVKKQKGSKKNSKPLTCNDKENYGSVCDQPMDNLFLRVMDAYLRPKCHSADSNAVHRVLALHPFDQSRLHQICAQFFEWSPEKTDGYILPKIAERKLRRFANLRSSSANLGVAPPINEIPVKCPVSCIIKQRKNQGRDYFEVSWEDMDGLESSAVPADLVESACPEKIAEFHERKAQKKKPVRKPQPKKTDNANANATKEINEKLQTLLLEIEQTSTTTFSATNLRALSPKNIPTIVCEVNPVPGRQHCHTQLEVNSQGCEEVIDLTSPPLAQARPCAAPKCEPVRCIDVIELSDSENDASPEHARKARELRLFMASLHDEIS